MKRDQLRSVMPWIFLQQYKMLINSFIYGTGLHYVQLFYVKYFLLVFSSYFQASVKDSISKFMAYVHTTVNEISRLYLSNERRYNYTTPKSFLEQIKLYQNLLLKKGRDLTAKMERLENGLEKLNSTSAQVRKPFGVKHCWFSLFGSKESFTGWSCTACKICARSGSRLAWTGFLEEKFCSVQERREEMYVSYLLLGWC